MTASWTCNTCGASGAADDIPAADLAGLNHHAEAHPFGGEADIAVGVVR